MDKNVQRTMPDPATDKPDTIPPSWRGTFGETIGPTKSFMYALTGRVAPVSQMTEKHLERWCPKEGTWVKLLGPDVWLMFHKVEAGCRYRYNREQTALVELEPVPSRRRQKQEILVTFHKSTIDVQERLLRVVAEIECEGEGVEIVHPAECRKERKRTRNKYEGQWKRVAIGMLVNYVEGSKPK